MIEEQRSGERFASEKLGGPALPVTIGRYKVREQLASGSSSELFKASTFEPHGFETVVAIKRLLPALVRDPAKVRRFVDAIKITGQLAHRSIVEVLEDRSDVDPPYVVMPYIDGVDVAALALICAARAIPVPASLAALVLREVLDALEHAHAAGIIHRDVSPGNVILTWSGDVKLVDFGKAEGTPGYAAPEQLAGDADARSMVFGAGVVLAELVMARRLFDGATEREVAKAVRENRLDVLHAHNLDFPIELLAMVLRALQRRPEDRWQTPGEFRDALDGWLAGTGSTKLELAVFLCELSNDDEPSADHEVTPDGVPSIEVDEGVTHRMPTAVVMSPVEIEATTPAHREPSQRFAHGTRGQPAIVVGPPPATLDWRWWHWVIGGSIAAALGGALAYLV